MEYEICSDPFDPRFVRATSMYRTGAEPKKSKLMLERTRGKEEDMIHNFTRQEEFNLINEQIKKSQVSFSLFLQQVPLFDSINHHLVSKFCFWMFVKRALTSISPCSGSFSISTCRFSMKAIQPKNQKPIETIKVD